MNKKTILSVVSIIFIIILGFGFLNFKKENSSKLSEKEILNATYTISTNFSKEIPTKNVTFTELSKNETSEYQALTKTLFIYSDGATSTDLIGGKDYEMFYISKYEMNPDQLEANVYISGNFVGKNNDNRVFLVKKTSNSVITEEQAITK